MKLPKSDNLEHLYERLLEASRQNLPIEDVIDFVNHHYTPEAILSLQQMVGVSVADYYPSLATTQIVGRGLNTSWLNRHHGRLTTYARDVIRGRYVALEFFNAPDVPLAGPFVARDIIAKLSVAAESAQSAAEYWCDMGRLLPSAKVISGLLLTDGLWIKDCVRSNGDTMPTSQNYVTELGCAVLPFGDGKSSATLEQLAIGRQSPDVIMAGNAVPVDVAGAGAGTWDDGSGTCPDSKP